MPMNTLAPEEQRIARVIIAVLEHREEQEGISGQAHVEHHRIITEWIQRENQKAKRREKIMNSVIGSVIVGVLGGLITGLGYIGKLAYTGFQHGVPPHP